MKRSLLWLAVQGVVGNLPIQPPIIRDGFPFANAWRTHVTEPDMEIGWYEGFRFVRYGPYIEPPPEMARQLRTPW